jgi:hypothetical protein
MATAARVVQRLLLVALIAAYVYSTLDTNKDELIKQLTSDMVELRNELRQERRLGEEVQANQARIETKILSNLFDTKMRAKKLNGFKKVTNVLQELKVSVGKNIKDTRELEKVVMSVEDNFGKVKAQLLSAVRDANVTLSETKTQLASSVAKLTSRMSKAVCKINQTTTTDRADRSKYTHS